MEGFLPAVTIKAFQLQRDTSGVDPGNCPGTPPPLFFRGGGIPKLQKEGGNFARMCVDGPHFSS